MANLKIALMKSKLRFGIVLVLLIFNLSELMCSTAKLDTIAVSGKIINADPKTKKIRIIANRVGVESVNYYTEIDDSGNFVIKFTSYYPTEIRIIYDVRKANFLFLAHPGEELYVEIDYNSKKNVLESVHFKGNGSSENQKIIRFQMIADSLWPIYDNAPIVASQLNHIQFKNYMDSLNRIVLSYYNSFITSEKPNDEVKTWAYYLCQENYYSGLYSYPEWHSKSDIYKDWNIPISYFDFQKEFMPIKKEYLISTYFFSRLVNQSRAVISYLNYLSNQAKIEEKVPFNEDSVKLYGIVNYSYDPLMKQLVLAELLSSSFKKNNISMYEKYNKIINQTITESFLRNPLQKQYELTKERITNPQLASDAIIKDYKSSTVKAIFDSIATDNKNKVIYIDCWGPWCAPCLKELPYSKEMMNKLKNEAVSFVFLCIDSEKDKWKAKIAEMQLKGTHYFLNKEQSADLREVLKIDGVPFYVLINRKGLIVEKGSHLRASDLSTLQKIETLMNEK
jgi:thiol-disulfide isomerase/thioredoxin